ncbi:hypothetical protein D3C84_1039520 [compost metagenome]
MTGIAVADPLVLSGVGRPARVTGDGFLHAFDMLKHTLDAPEATAGEHGGFAVGLGDFVECGCGDDDRVFGGSERERRALADDASGGQSQQGATQGEQGFHEADS